MMEKRYLATESQIEGTLMPEGGLALLATAGGEAMAPSAESVESDAASSIPSSHFIKDVPWHQQMDGLSCAAGALETVFHYWGADIDQKEIMNVARTSSSGTLSHDVVRTGQFSKLSEAQGSYFPSLGPKGGFSGRQYGYAAFSRTSDECWINDLKALIADDIPVIVLMLFEPTGGGGHYRVVIGYDDAQQLIYFCEPWGRDANHQTERIGIIAWSYSDFERAWNYSEEGVYQPYYGAIIIPWTVNITMRGDLAAGSILTIKAKISYLCPRPFDSSQFPSQEAVARITLPEGMSLVSGSAEISIGTLKAGSDIDATWKVLCSTIPFGRSVSVAVWGKVSGWVPESSWQGQSVSYPAYRYSDIIGGEGNITL